jgi:hypothetical protein
MPFKPGNNANPGGRPRKTKEQVELEKRCQEYMAKEGWVALLEMAKHRDAKVKQWALSTMLDRGFGKPTEVLDVTTRDESAYSPDELANSITELIAGEKAKGDGASIPSEGTA